MGTRLGPYEIQSALGAGGMGEVYRARDTRLRRDVAIKILPPEFSAEQSRLRRFEDEARSASALNHPNIVSVFDVGAAELPEGRHTTHFIVTELVEGVTLRETLEAGTMPVRQVTRIGAEIADGLGAAHDAAIIHRDLKPENVMLGPDGRVKILDFGLAKPDPRRADGAETRTVLSSPGVMLGTAGYFSPEQVRGEEIDTRSDLFALGLMLHEMAAGQRPFARGTTVETLNAILNDDPPELPDGVPTGLRHIIAHSLEKQRGRRFQSAHDVGFALRALAFTTPINTVAQSDGRRGARRFARLAAVLSVLILVVGGVLAGLRLGSATHTISEITLTPGAVEANAEHSAWWSHDGRSLAYYRESTTGNVQIVTRPWNTPIATVLWEGELFAPQQLFWSADSSRIFFSGSPRLLQSVATSGGVVRRELSDVLVADVAPDGRTVAALKAGATEGRRWCELWIGNSVDTLRRYAPQPFQQSLCAGGPNTLRIAPDGSKLLLWAVSTTAALHILPLHAEGRGRRVFEGMLSAMQGASWLPDSRHVVLSMGGALWLGDTDAGTLSRLTTGTTATEQPAVSPDGRRVVFTDSSADYDVVELSLSGGLPKTVVGTSQYDGNAAWTERGRRLAYVSRRSGVDEIWIRTAEDSEQRLIGSEDFAQGHPDFIRGLTFSPDGEWLSFLAIKFGPPEEWKALLVPSRGGVPRLIDEGPVVSRPTWSPDGTSLVMTTDRDGLRRVEVMTRSDGRTRVLPLTNKIAGGAAIWSPAGEWIAVTQYMPAGQQRPTLLVSPDGKNVRVLPPLLDANSVRGSEFTWSPDGRTLYAIGQESGRSVLRALDVQTNALRVAAKYDAAIRLGDPVGGFSTLTFGPEGLLITQETTRSDLWILTGLQVPRPWWQFPR